MARVLGKKRLFRLYEKQIYLAIILLLATILIILNKKSDTPQADPINLLIPSRVVYKGEKLADVPFIKVVWQKEKVTDAYLLAESILKDEVASVELPAMMPIPIRSIYSQESTENTVLNEIPRGMRAITVKVDLESAVEGWARPGNIVDVILLKNDLKKSDTELEAQVIAQNVKILSLGRTTKVSHTSLANFSSSSTVTLLTPQKDALKIKAAAGVGKLTFMLRAVNDDSPSSIRQVSKKDLSSQETSLPHIEKYNSVIKGPDGKMFVFSEEKGLTPISELPEDVRIESSLMRKVK